MEQIARRGVDVGRLARPDRHRKQHHVHRGKTRHRQTTQQILHFLGVGAFEFAHRERADAIAERPQNFRYARGLEIRVAPAHPEAPARIVEPSLRSARQRRDGALDDADAGGAGDPLHREVDFAAWFLGFGVCARRRHLTLIRLFDRNSVCPLRLASSVRSQTPDGGVAPT